MKRSYLLSLPLLLLLSCHSPTADKPAPPVEEAPPLFIGQNLPLSSVLTTITLGSCNRQDQDQKIWGEIDDEESDLWIWLGDNIYGDSEDVEVLKSKYLQQKYHPAYQVFREKTPIIGIWDDHDYGVNDGDKNYPKKKESQGLMLDFLDVPLNAPVRTQVGGFQSYSFGTPGKMVKVILLDARYFRDELERNATGYQRYKPNAEGDILGEAQWAWLEEELTNSDAQVHFIASGIQMIPEEHGFEKWANFPKARARLLDLLATSQVSYPILLSGDRHISEFSRLELPTLSHPVYEFTSSGLTHSYDSFSGEPNKHRVGEVVFQRNYGVIKMDWSAGVPALTFQMKGLNGDLLQELALNF